MNHETPRQAFDHMFMIEKIRDINNVPVYSVTHQSFGTPAQVETALTFHQAVNFAKQLGTRRRPYAIYYGQQLIHYEVK